MTAGSGTQRARRLRGTERAMLRAVAVVYIIDGRQVGSLEDFW
jgi:hypothetical protein